MSTLATEAPAAAPKRAPVKTPSPAPWSGTDELNTPYHYAYVPEALAKDWNKAGAVPPELLKGCNRAWEAYTTSGLSRTAPLPLAPTPSALWHPL